jgi:hypothetical protein
MQFGIVKSGPVEDAFAVSAQKLAKQLLKADNDQRVEVLDIRGAVAKDLHRAFEEWYAQSKQTKCLKYLYSVSIIPDPAERGISSEQYFNLIERIEKTLGLSQQPRAVVRHVYHDDRENWHTVWSRIDSGKGVAINFSHDWKKLRRVAQEFASDYGIASPPGLLTRFHDHAGAKA